MTIELKPLGNSCNLGCTYCYQEPMRLAGNTRASKTYDLDLMLELADERQGTLNSNQPLTLFGGEALLLPIKDLEKVAKHSFEKYGNSGLQTNGSLITDKHIEIFKKYNVSIGVSIDGPNELNSLRKSTQKNKTTDELTSASIENVRKLINAGISVGLIITIHKLNGTKDKLPRLKNFIRWLGDIGVRGGNIHLMEIDSIDAYNQSLSSEENTEAFLELAKFFSENRDLHYAPFADMESMVIGDPNEVATGCVWKNCDAMNTQSVYGIEGNGAISNCGMVNKEGIEWYKANDTNFMRDYILYQTEPEKNGCKGCPYFMMCNGYCPGSAINGDWRNKTIHCSTLKSLFAFYETKLEEKGGTPITKLPYYKGIEELYVNMLKKGDRVKLNNYVTMYKEMNNIK